MGRLPYDNSDKKDILYYSNKLINLSFEDVLVRNLSNDELEERINFYNNPKLKGGLGTLLEKHYFFYNPNSDSNPDFLKAGIELKTTPYEINKNGLSAGERLVITMIPNTEPIDIEFEGSHLEKKMRLILMIWYLREENIPRTKYKIDFVNLFDLYSEACSKDLEIILDDYKKIVDKVITGNAHKLSEADTVYLAACTKGASASKSIQPQYYNKNIPAKKRAFSLKPSYMTYVLNNYVKNGLMSYDSIFGKDDLIDCTFDQKVVEKINKYVGKMEKELYEEFNIVNLKKSKQINKILVNKMLGVNSDNSEEFEKANITIKTIRVKKNGLPKESMSFPKINIKKFIKKDFFDSYEYNFFETQRFLFVVFKENDEGNYILKGSTFWNMPIDELETIGKKEWEWYKNKFISGVNFEIKINKKGKLIVYNDLPNKSETKIFHMRPHSSKSAYLINGKKYGNGDETDMDLLPNGDKMTKQCFWLNNEYISKIIKNLLK